MAKDPALYEKAIGYVKSKGYDKVRANAEGYDAPTTFRRDEEGGIIMTPDITGVKSRRKYYFELAEKDLDLDVLPFPSGSSSASVANAQNGKLFLLAPHGHKAFATRVVEKHNIDAEVVAL